MALSLHTKQKQSLQLSLKLWLPLLQAPLNELETILKEYSYENPFLECNSNFESNYSSSSSLGDSEYDKRNFIENSSLYKPSLYEKIDEQIDEHLFPTPKSQKIAQDILFYINNEGYFEGNIEQIAIKNNVTNEFVDSIRKRFKYLEPCGVGAVNMIESFQFQLDDLDLNEDLYHFMQTLINNLSNMDKYHKHHYFEDAKHLLKKFNNPPAIEYQDDDPYIIPDFFVEIDDDIKIRINNDYYPDIVVTDPFRTKNDELKEKLKEARNLVNLLDLRKSTLYKLVLLIVEKQIRFFVGSELRPLTMNEIAQELGFEESTISRAVSNKYIKCSLGTFPLKHFFTNAVSKDLSSSEIKNFLKQLVENEDQDNPLTDQDMVDMVKKRYDIDMVRRTITKYRKLLDIASSKERKKFYTINQ